MILPIRRGKNRRFWHIEGCFLLYWPVKTGPFDYGEKKRTFYSHSFDTTDHKNKREDIEINHCWAVSWFAVLFYILRKFFNHSVLEASSFRNIFLAQEGLEQKKSISHFWLPQLEVSLLRSSIYFPLYDQHNPPCSNFAVKLLHRATSQDQL